VPPRRRAQFDDLLEDLSRAAVERRPTLSSFAAPRVENNESLTAIERVERPGCSAHSSRLHELERYARGAQPQLYGEILAASLATQVSSTMRPPRSGRTRALETPPGAAMMLAAPRTSRNRGIYIKTASIPERTLRFSRTTFQSVRRRGRSGLLGDLADAQTEAIDAIKATATTSRATWRRGLARHSGWADKFAQKLRLTTGSM